jgi:hypothetical protein
MIVEKHLKIEIAVHGDFKDAQFVVRDVIRVFINLMLLFAAIPGPKIHRSIHNVIDQVIVYSRVIVFILI